MTTLDKERLKRIEPLKIDRGGHKPPNGEIEFCIMEAVAYVAGEKWSDRPECASKVIGQFLRTWNDNLDDEGRQMLKPLIPKLVGTAAGKKVEERRGWMCADWLIRVYTPAWLKLAGVTESAAALRSLPEVRTLTSLRKAQPTINEARRQGAAAWAAARDAAWGAAWHAAGAAARDAAWAAARDAAWGAAWHAAGAAARDAAWDAAGAAAGAAAREKLAPTQTELQKLALDLVERMIAA